MDDKKSKDESPGGREPEQLEPEENQPEDGTSDNEYEKSGDHDVVLLSAAVSGRVQAALPSSRDHRLGFALFLLGQVADVDHGCWLKSPDECLIHGTTAKKPTQPMR